MKVLLSVCDGLKKNLIYLDGRNRDVVSVSVKKKRGGKKHETPGRRAAKSTKKGKRAK